MIRSLLVLVSSVLLLAVVQSAHADGIWIGRGPISCEVPMDSLDLNKCEGDAVRQGDTGHCITEGTRDGKRYTITIRVSGRDIPTRSLPPLADNIFTKGKLHCRIESSEPLTGRCSATGNNSGGSGHCVYCTPKGCHEGSASISIKEKKPLRKAFAE